MKRSVFLPQILWPPPWIFKAAEGWGERVSCRLSSFTLRNQRLLSVTASVAFPRSPLATNVYSALQQASPFLVHPSQPTFTQRYSKRRLSSFTPRNQRLLSVTASVDFPRSPFATNVYSALQQASPFLVHPSQPTFTQRYSKRRLSSFTLRNQRLLSATASVAFPRSPFATNVYSALQQASPFLVHPSQPTFTQRYSKRRLSSFTLRNQRLLSVTASVDFPRSPLATNVYPNQTWRLDERL